MKCAAKLMLVQETTETGGADMATQLTNKVETSETHETGATDSQSGGNGLGIGIGALSVGVLSIMAVYNELFVDALVLLAVLGTVAMLATRTGSRWLYWILAVLTTVFLGFNLVYSVSDLSHPESTGPFVPTAIVNIAGVIIIAFAVLAALGRPVPARKVWLGAGAFIVVAAVGSLAAAATVDDDVAQPGDITVVAEDVKYPELVALTPEAEGLFLVNNDNYRHNFVIDGLVEPVELPANTSVRVAIDLPEPGTYRFYCSVPGHTGMEGKLVIQ